MKPRDSAVSTLRFATLVLLAACAGEPSGPGNSGTMQFVFSGALAGNFSVSGEIQPNTNGPSGAAAWSVSQSYGQDYIFVHGQHVVPPNGTDVLDLRLFRVKDVGRIEFCDFLGPPLPCLLPGFFQPAGKEQFRITSGTVTITTLTPNRMRGTFSASTTSFERIEVANGSFDVPLAPRP